MRATRGATREEVSSACRGLGSVRGPGLPLHGNGIVCRLLKGGMAVEAAFAVRLCAMVAATCASTALCGHGVHNDASQIAEGLHACLRSLCLS